jgi:hypothetical protein
MTLCILAGLIEIIAVLVIVGTATLATSLWWALCERLACGGMTWYTPPAIVAALRGYQPSAGTGGFLLQAPAGELVLGSPPFSVRRDV